MAGSFSISVFLPFDRVRYFSSFSWHYSCSLMYTIRLVIEIVSMRYGESVEKRRLSMAETQINREKGCGYRDGRQSDEKSCSISVIFFVNG